MCEVADDLKIPLLNSFYHSKIAHYSPYRGATYDAYGPCHFVGGI